MPEIRAVGGNAVPGCATPDRLSRFLAARNPALEPRFSSIAGEYAVIGQAYGVRWDFAFFQMLVETNALSFRRPNGEPADVRASQNNFAGIGAVGDGNPGESFPDITTGIQAHMEHILIYAGVNIANPVAERTRNVLSWKVLDEWLAGFDRPVTFRDLALRWAPFQPSYADAILATARRFYEQHCPGSSVADWLEPGRARSEPKVASTQVASAWISGAPQPNASRAAPIIARDMEPPLLVRPPREVTAETARPPERAVRARSQPASAAAPPPARRPAAGQLQSREPKPLATAAIMPVPRPETSRGPQALERTPDDEIRDLVSGQTVELKTDMGAVIPIRFRDNGSMYGEAGGLAFFLGAARDQGKWWTEDGKLCKQWKVWLSAKRMCLTLKQRGDTIIWRANDGRSGTAQIVRGRS